MLRAYKDLFAGTPLVGFINILDPINGIFGQKNEHLQCQIFNLKGILLFSGPPWPCKEGDKSCLDQKLIVAKLLASKIIVHWVENYWIFKMLPDTPPQFERAANKFLFARIVPANKFLFAGTVPANNLFLNGSKLTCPELITCPYWPVLIISVLYHLDPWEGGKDWEDWYRIT